jgi:alpha-amylase
VNTRWGSKSELIEAVTVARNHGIDVLIDAVLNVRMSVILCLLNNNKPPVSLQHKLGADRTEVFKAIPVDERNRLKDIGSAREIEVDGIV